MNASASRPELAPSPDAARRVAAALRRAATGFLTAVQFLTRIPVPEGDYRLGDAVVWLPAVGQLLGTVLALAYVGLRLLGAPSLLESALLVVLLLVATGALHADGLVDTFDAAFSHASPQRRLEIMRDPHAGAFGVVALVSVVALKVAALDGMPIVFTTGMLIVAPALGRWAIVLLACVFPYGRANGLGEPLKNAATPRALVIASVLPLLACVLVGPLGVVSALLAALVALGLGLWLIRLLPGLTGDSYGAACELVEAAVWVAGALLGPRLMA